MSDSQEKREISYFIDEAGDTTLFDRRGKHVLLGNLCIKVLHPRKNPSR